MQLPWRRRKTREVPMTEEQRQVLQKVADYFSLCMTCFRTGVELGKEMERVGFEPRGEIRFQYATQNRAPLYPPNEDDEEQPELELSEEDREVLRAMRVKV